MVKVKKKKEENIHEVLEKFSLTVRVLSGPLSSTVIGLNISISLSTDVYLSYTLLIGFLDDTSMIGLFGNMLKSLIAG